MRVIRGRVLTPGYAGLRTCSFCEKDGGDGDLLLFCGGVHLAAYLCGSCAVRIEQEGKAALRESLGDALDEMIQALAFSAQPFSPAIN